MKCHQQGTYPHGRDGNKDNPENEYDQGRNSQRSVLDHSLHCTHYVQGVDGRIHTVQYHKRNHRTFRRFIHGHVESIMKCLYHCILEL